VLFRLKYSIKIFDISNILAKSIRIILTTSRSMEKIQPTYNLRKICGTLKGDVGEAIFLSLNKYAHGTRFDSVTWLLKAPFHVPESFVAFLEEHWLTIDAFEFIVENGLANTIIFYEIKTVNYYTRNGINFGKKPYLTRNAHRFYNLAKEKGFSVKTALIIFYENWNFSLKINDYDDSDFLIYDGNPLYSKQMNTLNHKTN
jgi:hypothetical protein